jgi:hypothetical protein
MKRLAMLILALVLAGLSCEAAGIEAVGPTQEIPYEIYVECLGGFITAESWSRVGQAGNVLQANEVTCNGEHYSSLVTNGMWIVLEK